MNNSQHTGNEFWPLSPLNTTKNFFFHMLELNPFVALINCKGKKWRGQAGSRYTTLTTTPIAPMHSRYRPSCISPPWFLAQVCLRLCQGWHWSTVPRKTFAYHWNVPFHLHVYHVYIHVTRFNTDREWCYMYILPESSQDTEQTLFGRRWTHQCCLVQKWERLPPGLLGWVRSAWPLAGCHHRLWTFLPLFPW